MSCNNTNETINGRTDSNKNIRETTRKYFDAAGNPISGGLIGEESESVTAFSSIAAYSKLAINNVLNYRDTTITADPAVGFNTDPLGCADIRSSIDSLIGIVTTHVGASIVIIASFGVLYPDPPLVTVTVFNE